MAPLQPSAARLSPSPWRHPCLILGTVTGACLAGIAVAWLLVANRVPSLAQFAFERNVIAGAAIGTLMLLPFFLFLGSPARIFVSSVIAWAILALAYDVMEILFARLGTRLGAFHLFMLGAVAFGMLAVLDWVALLLFAAWRNPAVATRR
jgi:hypothetical protein